MLHFLSGVYASVFGENEYNVLLIGAESAGKTTLLEQLKYMYNNNNNAAAAAAAVVVDTPVEQQLHDDSHADGGSSSSSRKMDAGSSGSGNLDNSNSNSSSGNHTSSHTLVHSDNNTQRQRCQQAVRAYMAAKRIRPTVGVNNAHLTHHYHRGKSSTSAAAAAATTTSANAVYERTRLQLWDLGGQRELRSLWVTYFSACQAVIFVVDSTLPYTNKNNNNSCRRSSSSTNNGSGHGDNDSNDKDTTVGDGAAVTRQAMRDAHRGNRALLQRLLVHPDLHAVPFLVLSNKADVTPHMSLAQVQDALGVVDLALHASFYTFAAPTPLPTPLRNDGDDDDDDDSDGAAVALKSMTATCHGAPALSASPSTAARAAAAVAATAEATATNGERTCSGFGCITWKLCEVSALDGDGVAAVMDWLVTQLRRHARVVDDEDAR